MVVVVVRITPFALLFSVGVQVLTKEQLYVQPSQSVSPSSLPGGIKPEAVSSAAPLPVIIKQVSGMNHTPLII